MVMVIKPCELKDANTYIAKLHRHHKPIAGHRFSIAAWKDGVMVGVATVGRPVARMTNQKTVLEVTRLCTDGTRNACSILYAAAARIGRTIGYESIQTFILESAPGTSLKAAGWKPVAMSPGGDWNRPSRGARRTDQAMTAKQKWEMVW